MNTQAVYVHRAVPLLILGFSALMGLSGVAIFALASDEGFGISLIISAGAIGLIALPFFWMRVAVFEEEFVQLGRDRLAYRDIQEVTGTVEAVQRPSASAIPRRARVQDFLFVQKVGEDQPMRVPIAVSSQGPEAIAEMIMERVQKAQSGRPN